MVFLLVILTNLWIWKIISVNILLAVLLIVTSCLFFKSLGNKSVYFLLIIAYFLLFIFQYKTTSIQPLSALTKNEELTQIQRIKEYPPTFLQLGPKTLWIPAAHWLEERKELIVLRHMEENVFEVLDPNLYFFANHPRERVGYTEFEKFPYILLPFFLYGLYLLFNKDRKLLFWTTIPAFFLFSLIGSNNPLGPFLFFPIIVCSIVIGLQKTLQLIKRAKYQKYIVAGFLIVFIMVFIQVLSYAIH